MLNNWLSAYIAETRKVNGDPYPPATLRSLLSSLLHHMRSIDELRAPIIFASFQGAPLHHGFPAQAASFR